MPQYSAGGSRQSVTDLLLGSRALLIGGSALVLLGLSRRSKPGMAMAAAGGLLAYKAAQTDPPEIDQAQARFLVNATPEQAYARWRDFESLPRFMAHLESVRVLDERHSKWTAKGAMGVPVSWTAEITEDAPNRRIEWRSSPDSIVQTSGWVDFHADPQGRGTYVMARVLYGNPLGAAGRALLTMLGSHPQFLVREDLRRFKALLETGETATIAGQTHGPRGLHGRGEAILFRETSNLPRPQAA